MKRIGLCLAIVALLLSSAAVAQADDGGGYAVTWYTVAGGGGTASAGDFVVNSTSGQHDAGTLIGGEFSLHGGFWFASPFRPFMYFYFPWLPVTAPGTGK
jgi:hypothetical protein